jgi:hypothetical protein
MAHWMPVLNRNVATVKLHLPLKLFIKLSSAISKYRRSPRVVSDNYRELERSITQIWILVTTLHTTVLHTLNVGVPSYRGKLSRLVDSSKVAFLLFHTPIAA